ncbi:MAG: ABC transporter, partial [Spirochaetaceae bacterium]|nr:ABC transporter [Spirochaetaceae bacterium]
MITVENLRKTYRVKKRSAGLAAAAAAIVRPRYDTVEALRGVSFRVGPGEIV